MADKTTGIKSWTPGPLNQVVGLLNQAAQAVSGLTNTLTGIVNTAATGIDIVANIVPSEVDTVNRTLTIAINTANTLLSNFTDLSGSVSVLVIPPVGGGEKALGDLLVEKLQDERDFFRPNPNVKYHAGVVAWVNLEGPNEAIQAFESLQTLFSPGNPLLQNKPTGLTVPRPEADVVISGGKPLVSWEYPHVFDMTTNRIPVRDAVGNSVAFLRSVEEVRILRGTEVLQEGPTNLLDTTYVDNAATPGAQQYTVEFTYKLSNNSLLERISSEIIEVVVPDQGERETTSSVRSGGQFPGFYGASGNAVIPSLDLALDQIKLNLDVFSDRASSFQKILQDTSAFIREQTAAVSAQINAVVQIVEKLVAGLSFLQNNKISFIAYEGQPLGCISPEFSALPEAPAISLATGFFIDAGSDNQLIANTTIGGIKALFGFGGRIKALDDLGTLAASVREVAGAISNISQNVNSQILTATNREILEE